MTLWQLVCTAAEKMPEKVILADDHGRSLITVAYRDAAERVADALEVDRRAVVSWQLPTTIEAAVLMAALARLDVVQNPIIPVLRDREVRRIARQLNTSLFVVPETWRGFAHGDMARDLGCRVLKLDLEHTVGTDLRLPLADLSGHGEHVICRIHRAINVSCAEPSVERQYHYRPAD